MTTTAHTAAARNARILADVLRSRAALHPERDALLAMTGHLHTAADSIEAHVPAADGANGTPARGALFLDIAQGIAAEVPAAGIADEVFLYVTAPITGTLPEATPQGAESAQLARQELDLLARINTVRENHLDDGSEEVLRAALEALVTLHGKLGRLRSLAA
ncbi:hypothetical protein [Streptomyces sp. NPDC088847]|uniref:hypothetical protein n=1 Tax=Streptomyces sp. NPDC088847 TaxID=3365909 RepID=UPI0037F9DE07